MLTISGRRVRLAQFVQSICFVVNEKGFIIHLHFMPTQCNWSVLTRIILLNYMINSCIRVLLQHSFCLSIHSFEKKKNQQNHLEWTAQSKTQLESTIRHCELISVVMEMPFFKSRALLRAMHPPFFVLRDALFMQIQNILWATITAKLQPLPLKLKLQKGIGKVKNRLNRNTWENCMLINKKVYFQNTISSLLRKRLMPLFSLHRHIVKRKSSRT